MPNAEKTAAVAEITERLHYQLRGGHHRVPRPDGQAGHTAAPGAGPRHDLRGRQEHPDQARRRRGRRRDRRQRCSPARRRSRSSRATRSRRPRACAISLRPTRCWSSRAACSTARRCPPPRSTRSPISSRVRSLLAKLAGALKALPTRAAGLFQAPLSQMARLAKALEEKKPAGDAPPTRTDSRRRGCRPNRHKRLPPSRRSSNPQPAHPARRKDATHGEAQHRRAARRFQGDDPPGAQRVREAVRGDLRRHRRRAGRGGRRPARPPAPLPRLPRSRTSSTSSSRPPARRRSRSSRRCARSRASA